MQVLFIAAVVFIVTNAAWSHRWHESFLRSQAPERGLQILNILFYHLLPSIADRPGADQRYAGHDASTHHSPAEVLLIIFREGSHFRRPLFASAAFSAFRFKAGETLAHVRKESRLSLLAVGHNVDAALGLLADNLRHRALDSLTEGLIIIRFAVDLGLHQIEQVLGARQTAGVGG